MFTLEETHYSSATKTNRLIPFRESIAGHSEYHTKHANTFSGQKAGFYLCESRRYIQNTNFDGNAKGSPVIQQYCDAISSSSG
jgi:hypothetical protein